MDSQATSGEDPGGARFGNFINYYQFNPAEERISHLPQNLMTELFPSGGQILALDVGCNAGELTVALQRKYSKDFHKLKILGVDIDPVLIQRAKESLKNNIAQNIGDEKSESTNKESDSNTKPSDASDVEFTCLDVMSEDGIKQIDKFLESEGRDRFDIIFVFSVSMWIHLHHGDSGLDRFLDICSSKSRFTLLEPQPWKCYQTAARRMRKLNLPEFPKLSEIKLRAESLEPGILNFASAHGMKAVKNFGETKWKRKLILFQSSELCENNKDSNSKENDNSDV